MLRMATTGLVGAVIGLGLVASADASPTATVSAAFVPDRLGASTALVFSFGLGDTSGGIPEPITQVATMLPAGSQIDTTGLGVCRAVGALVTEGASACPSSSFVGFGSALASADLGADTLNEMAPLSIFLAPSTPATRCSSSTPTRPRRLSEQLAFAGTQEPASAPYGLEFVVDVPAIATVPGGPDASIVSLRSTIGAPNAQYYVTRKDPYRHHATRRRAGGEGDHHGDDARAAAREGPRRAGQLPGRRLSVRDAVHVRGRHHDDGGRPDRLPVGGRASPNDEGAASVWRPPPVIRCDARPGGRTFRR